jgi:hypothetical protein
MITSTNPQTNRRKTKGPYDPTYHRDGTVTYWSVYHQRWVHRSRSISDEELAAAGDDRARIMRHLQ